MPALLEKMRGADVAVYATPLYTFTVSGMMKDFLDRSIPLIQPFISVEDGLSRHPVRYEGSRAVPVVISNCGFPEQGHFSGMRETFRQLFAHSRREPAAMICCAGGEMLRRPEARGFCGWYLDAVRLAGREVVCAGRVSEATARVLDHPLCDDAATFARMANASLLSMGCEPIGEEAKALVAAL
jgi:hypothetical protein